MTHSQIAILSQTMTKVLLLILFGLVIGNANSSQEGIAKILALKRDCIQEVIGEPGWRCSDNTTCLPLSNVCDTFDTQCPNLDDSDESIGCGLFPETGCDSVGAQKLVKCPHSDQCVPEQNKDELCQSINKPTNDSTCCKLNCPQFRCRNGHCIAKTFVCNKEFECQDDSDETEGCELHGPECKSWNGQRHVPCHNDSTICTLPEFQDSDCRRCQDENHWRCNDGWCIEKTRLNDGVADCSDRSDEESGT